MMSGHREQILRAAAIHEKFVAESTELNEAAKKVLIHFSQSLREVLTTKPGLTASHTRTISNELFAYWHETINSYTEKFWHELVANGVDIERKDPLQFALGKNRFRKVENGIDAKNNWAEVKTLKTIRARFSDADILQIDSIIERDEKARLLILEKCLRKKAIPPSQYLKFGECMAYFNNCRLFDQYFTPDQVEVLYTTWRDFK